MRALRAALARSMEPLQAVLPELLLHYKRSHLFAVVRSFPGAENVTLSGSKIFFSTPAQIKNIKLIIYFADTR